MPMGIVSELVMSRCSSYAVKTFTTVLLVYLWSPVTASTFDNNIINSMNQIKEEKGSKITYDNNGNLTAKGDRTMTWSVENYLFKVENTLGDLGEYKYDV